MCASAAYDYELESEISVITTSMNYAEYIEDCIKSVQEQQTPLKINHIIMDGGSTDGTIKILEKFKDRIYYYVNKGESQTAALNHAMKIIEEKFPKTDYIGWLNADDYYIPGGLEASLTALRREKPEVAMTCGGFGLVTGISPPRRKVAPTQLKTDNYKVIPYVQMRRLAKGNQVCQPTVLIKMSSFRTLKDKYGYYFDPADGYTQDYDLWCRFIISGFKIRRIAYTVAMFRYHPRQMSQTHYPQQREAANKVLKRIHIWLARVRKEGDE